MRIIQPPWPSYTTRLFELTLKTISHCETKSRQTLLVRCTPVWSSDAPCIAVRTSISQVNSQVVPASQLNLLDTVHLCAHWSRMLTSCIGPRMILKQKMSIQYVYVDDINHVQNKSESCLLSCVILFTNNFVLLMPFW